MATRVVLKVGWWIANSQSHLTKHIDSAIKMVGGLLQWAIEGTSSEFPSPMYIEVPSKWPLPWSFNCRSLGLDKWRWLDWHGSNKCRRFCSKLTPPLARMRPLLIRGNQVWLESHMPLTCKVWTKVLVHHDVAENLKACVAHGSKCCLLARPWVSYPCTFPRCMELNAQVQVERLVHPNSTIVPAKPYTPMANVLPLNSKTHVLTEREINQDL